MTNGKTNIANDRTDTPAGATAPGAMDWGALADARLTRLVELEHDCSVLRDRMEGLQLEYRELLVASDRQSRRSRELDQARVMLSRRLEDLTREHADMRASFLGSRSWRLTRPLRSLSASVSGARTAVGNVLRGMLRVRWLRRVAGIVARMVPGLHRRVRSRLYPNG